MCTYIGAIVVDRRFPDTIVGRVEFINAKAQTAIIETGRGWSVIPLYMIKVREQNGGRR